MDSLLTQEEAEELINILKKCIETSIALPTLGKRIDINIVSVINKSKNFVISINRKCQLIDKFSFIALYKKNNAILLRLDIGQNLRHLNPDGIIITGNHLHRYREGFEEKVAFPFNIDDNDLKKNFEIFLDIFNVNYESTNITLQTKMEI